MGGEILNKLLAKLFTFALVVVFALSLLSGCGCSKQKTENSFCENTTVATSKLEESKIDTTQNFSSNKETTKESKQKNSKNNSLSENSTTDNNTEKPDENPTVVMGFFDEDN